MAISQINAAIQRGKQAAANAYGQNYNICRLSNQNVTMIDSGVNNISASLARYTSRGDVEQIMFELLIFDVTASSINFNLGDVLVDTNSGEMFTMGSMRPLHNNLAVRTETMVSIYSPTTQTQLASATSLAQIIDPNYSADYIGNEYVLVLNNGVYSWSMPGSAVTPALVPCGIQPQARKGSDKTPSALPVNVADSYLVAFLPLLNVDINQTCVIATTTPNGESIRYKVEQSFTTAQIGFAGTILHLIKEDV